MKKLIMSIKLWLCINFTKEGRKMRDAYKLMIDVHGFLLDDSEATLFKECVKKL